MYCNDVLNFSITDDLHDADYYKLLALKRIIMKLPFIEELRYVYILFVHKQSIPLGKYCNVLDSVQRTQRIKINIVPHEKNLTPSINSVAHICNNAQLAAI